MNRVLLRAGAWAVGGLVLASAAFGAEPPGAREGWLKLDPLFRLQHAMSTPARPPGGTLTAGVLRADSIFSGFAEFAGSREQLEALGASVGTQTGSLFTVRLSGDALERLLRDDRLLGFEAARRMSPNLYASGQVIGSPVMHAPRPGFPDGIQGQGVLVGIADSGIDVDVDDFKDAFAVTRLVALWDQGFHFQPPPGYDYGTAYGPAELRAGVPYHKDVLGHGTHVAGIAAGNGRDTGRFLSVHHVGVAPRADIAVVKVDPFTLDVHLVDGVRWLFDVARSRGQDAVVNVSMGNQSGPRDGTSMLERMLSSLTGPGHILVFAAGNSAEEGIHTRIPFAPGAPGEASFTIPAHPPRPGPGNEFVTVEGWGAPGERAAVTVTSPGGATFGPVAAGEEASFTGSEGDVTLINGTTWPLRAPTTPQGNASPWFVLGIADRTDETHRPAPGAWTIHLASEGGSGTFDVWVDGIGFTTYFPWPHFGAQADPSRTLDFPGTCDSCITVASFVTMDAWQDSIGSASGYAANGILAAEVGALSLFSSRGPRRDGLARPDLAAPGQGVASSWSRDTGFQGWRFFEDASHVVLEGTSMAAPQVTGAVALLLQIRPHLPPARVRDILGRAAAADAFTGSVPNSDWGAGKLDLRNLIDVVNETFATGTAELSLSHLGNPSSAPLHFRIRAASAQSATELELFSIDGRRVLRQDIGAIPLGVTELVWNPVVRGSPLPSGVYFARVRSRFSEASDKVILLR